MAVEFNAGVVSIVPWVWNGGTQSLDNLYDIKPGDPTLSVLTQCANWPPLLGDIHHDSVVNIFDLQVLLSHWTG
jgi:hypothetical protein